MVSTLALQPTDEVPARLPLLPAESDGESRKVGGQTLVKGHCMLVCWTWLVRAPSRGYDLVTRVYLSAEADSEPAMASKRQYQTPPRRFCALTCQDAVA